MSSGYANDISQRGNANAQKTLQEVYGLADCKLKLTPCITAHLLTQ